MIASGPIISCQIDVETMERVTDYFLAPKSPHVVTAATKAKDAWLPGRKVMTNLDSLFKK